ncbi:MAG: hypothetical protein BWK77_07545 [Verrucomicrobia bacterium A1]|nr:MAG: hypothetical protein BWK77_07545 [Verrucomicrobia bacterium A1]
MRTGSPGWNRAAALAVWIAASAAPAAEWEFFAFDNGVGRGVWPPEKQAATLKELGYDGCNYGHMGFYAASAADSLRIAKKVAHPAVGPSYNLCHEFLTGNGDKAMETLRAVGSEALRVSINGVDPSDKKRFILALGEGSFDIAAFLAELKRIGYKGPVGHQFYSIPGEPEVNLKKAMEAWRKLQPK